MIDTTIEHDAVTWYAAVQWRRPPLPPRWECVGSELEGAMWVHRAQGLTVIESVHDYGAPPQYWHHVSVSRRSSLPSWDDLTLVRALFIGDDVECYSVFPPRARYVNHNPNVLHLWSRCDRPDGVLPDFRIAGTI